MDKLQHRKAARRIIIKDANGTPVANQSVHAKLTNHHFIFACTAFGFVPMLDPKVPAEVREKLQGYWEDWKQLFNLGILPFYQGRYEPVQGQTQEEGTLRAARFLKDNGRLVKGHPLCWHTVDARWLLEMDNDAVLENQLSRIRREVTAFKGLIDIWDVINEVVIMPEFDKTVNAITKLCQHMGRVPLVKAVFEEARRHDPDAMLLINDFNTSERYRQLVEDCLAAGVKPSAIGIQSHQHQGFWGLEKLAEVVERFEGFGLPLHFTETSFVSGHLMPPEIVDLNDYQIESWPSTPEGEDRQARDLLTMVDYLFERPSVDVFSLWGLDDASQWLGAPSGLIRVDGSRKPAYDALWQRINRDWSTDVTLHTDENGALDLEGFMGTYSLTCGGAEASVELLRGEGDIEVTI